MATSSWNCLLIFFVVGCLAIITASTLTSAVIQSVAAFNVLGELQEIKKAIHMLNEGNHIVEFAGRMVRDFEAGTSHLNMEEVIRMSVPDTNEEMSARLRDLGYGIRDAGNVASEIKGIDVVGMLKPLLQVAVKLSGKKETAIFGQAVSVIGNYIAKQADAGNVDVFFEKLKEVVNLVVDTLKTKSVRETLDVVHKRVDEMLQDERVAVMLDDFAHIVTQTRESRLVSSFSHGFDRFGDFSSFLGDMRRGVTISMGGNERAVEHKQNIEG